MLNFHFIDNFMNYFVGLSGMFLLGFLRSFVVFISNIIVGSDGLYDQQISRALSDQKMILNMLDR